MKITRTINGQKMSFELTKDELYQVLEEQEHRMTSRYDCVVRLDIHQWILLYKILKLFKKTNGDEPTLVRGIDGLIERMQITIDEMNSESPMKSPTRNDRE